MAIVATPRVFELVTVRLVMRVPRAVAHGTEWAPERAAADERRAVYFGPENGHVDTPVLSRHYRFVGRRARGRC
jgi:hypothetical protein